MRAVLSDSTFFMILTASRGLASSSVAVHVLHDEERAVGFESEGSHGKHILPALSQMSVMSTGSHG